MFFNLFALSPDAVWSFSQTAWWFLVMIGILVSFHELGHFLAARSVGVRVLKFSLGFGPKLIGRRIGETEYLVSAVPLGGYVKLFGEEEADALTPEDKRRSFAHQRLLSKMFIVAAGPGFNFLLAYLIFTGSLAIGFPLFVPTFRDLTPDVEALLPGSPADQAGIKVGDRIIRVNERDISTRSELLDAVQKSNGKQLTLDVRRDGQIKTILVTPQPTTFHEGGNEVVTYRIGTEDPPPVITAVMSGSPAMVAGLKEGDRVVSIEGRDIQTWSQMTGLVKESPNRPLRFEVMRDGQRVSLTVTPTVEKVVINGKPLEVGKIGISGPTGRSIIRAPSPLLAAFHGIQATWGWTELTVVGIYKMVAGEISSRNIGGPLTIANVSAEAAAQGASYYVFLIAVLSINLGVLNLLPIPILDGGHLLFFAIEAILRRPLGERQREIAQQVGLLLLVGIMVFAFWNDIERVILPLFHS
ncbi:MAG TPA: RIP metalloprotease RseP [Nitrospiraceae bacterium]|nr:RIP metalloprotease RseP [Nitrospiraceae bacterium]